MSTLHTLHERISETSGWRIIQNIYPQGNNFVVDFTDNHTGEGGQLEIPRDGTAYAFAMGESTGRDSPSYKCPVRKLTATLSFPGESRSPQQVAIGIAPEVLLAGYVAMLNNGVGLAGKPRLTP